MLLRLNMTIGIYLNLSCDLQIDHEMFLTEHGFRSRELNCYQRNVPDGTWNQIVRIGWLPTRCS